jgi:hypothetical protein
MRYRRNLPPPEALSLSITTGNPAMPRYYFDIISGNGRQTDEDGVDLPALDDARREALRTLGQIISEELPVHGTRISIEVRDEFANPVEQVTTEVKVERGKPGH